MAVSPLALHSVSLRASMHSAQAFDCLRPPSLHCLRLCCSDGHALHLARTAMSFPSNHVRLPKKPRTAVIYTPSTQRSSPASPLIFCSAKKVSSRLKNGFPSQACSLGPLSLRFVCFRMCLWGRTRVVRRSAEERVREPTQHSIPGRGQHRMTTCSTPQFETRR